MMKYLESVSAAVLSANEQGEDFALLLVRNMVTGGRFVSVRSQSPSSFVTGLRANAKSRNFGAYRSAVLESIRLYGVENHSIHLLSMHKTLKAARQAKKDLVERNALSSGALEDLNANRPVEGLKDNTAFIRWMGKDEIAEEQAKVKPVRKTKKPVTSTTSAVA